jgi:hypothetical protein
MSVKYRKTNTSGKIKVNSLNTTQYGKYIEVELIGTCSKCDATDHRLQKYYINRNTNAIQCLLCYVIELFNIVPS